MISNKIKNALAKANGLEAERRIEIIREGVQQEYAIPADELAILRKQMAEIVSFLSNKYEDFVPNEEFVAYNKKVEEIKTSAKQQMEV